MSLRLVPMTLATFRALASGDVGTAEEQIGAPLPTAFAEAIDIWRFMVRLVSEHPDNAGWAMQVVMTDGSVVGNAGFKGAPTNGQVEVGYRIVPEHRRRGLAVAALRTLLDQAVGSPEVTRVIARIDPGNQPSVGVVTRAGFVADGEHLHPRWGRQLQFAYATGAPPN